MKKYNSMYLGICINNNDPEKRGRVQIFIPHIMPALYEGWNKEKEDIDITCVGDNLPDGLSADIINRLSIILPWAEAASPILGTSAPGNLLTTIADTASEIVQGAKGIISSVFDQSPVAAPADIQDLQGLYNEASNWVGNDARGNKVKNSWNTTRGPGNCLRGSQAILGALTGHPRFNAGKAGGLGESAKLYSGAGGQTFTGTGLYDPPQSIPSNYMGDSSQWQVGDTVVCGGGDKGYGHIQVWTGKAWVSDFTQKGIIQKSNYHSFVLHRPNAAGKARIAERAPALMGSSATAPPEATSMSGEVAAASPHQTATPIATDSNKPEYGSIANPDASSSVSALSGSGGANLKLSNTQQNSLNHFQKNYQANYGRYEAVSNNLKAQGYNMSPAQVAAFHYRECSGNFKKSVANGESLNNYVRKDGIMGGGTPSNSFTKTDNWEQNASEVLAYKLNEKYGASAKSKDFSNNAQFYDFAERFNGMGYRKKGVASPYIWAGTDQYSGGKYVKDGVYDPNHVDQQPGIASLIATAEGTPIDATAQSLAGMPMSGGGGGMVNNTDPHGPITTQNLNNVAKGVFTYPAAGSMLWVFFREGNPLFPVYFAASYSKDEWSSAYGLASDGPGYRPTSTPDNPTVSTGGIMNLNGVGGLRWEHTSNPQDRISDQKSIMLFGEDGSNVFMGKGYNQYFSKFDRRDQVEGDRWETTLGFKEEWTQGDSNQVVMGDLFVKVGNVSQPAVNAVQRIQEIIADIQSPLSESSGSPSQSSSASSSAETAASKKAESYNSPQQPPVMLNELTPTERKELDNLFDSDDAWNASK